MNYNYARHYESLKEEVYKNYGARHLCGDCVYTTSCKRAEIQALNNPKIKAGLIKKHAPFVKEFEVEGLHRNQQEVGFVAVYDCERFLFDNPKGERICGMNLQYSVNQ